MAAQISCKTFLIWQEGIKIEFVITPCSLYIIIEVCYLVSIMITLEILDEWRNPLFDILKFKEV